MHANIYVKLDPAFGVDSGPFDVYTNLNLVLPILENVPRSLFIAGDGLLLQEVDDAATSIVLVSKGGCCNTTYIPIVDITTTTSTTTSTTTGVPSIPCGTPVLFSGAQSYPTTNTVSLGSGTGTTKFTFNGIINPDRFIVEWNSAVVIDTGYRGSSSYDYGGPLRNTFNNALTGDIDPITLIAYPDLVNYPDDGYPRVTNNTAFAPANPGSGSTTFTKTLSSPTTATVKVYAPGGGTQWNFTMDCPIPIPTTTTTTTSTTSTTTTGPTTTSTTSTTTTNNDTTTTTTTTTSTTTTTTTLALDFSIVADCSGSEKGKITAYNYRYGSGVYDYVASGSTANYASSSVAGIAGYNTRYPAGSSYAFSNLGNGSYYIALMDSANNVKTIGPTTIECYDNLYLEYANGGSGTQTWDIMYSYTGDNGLITVSAAAAQTEAGGVYVSGPVGVTLPGTVVTIQVRKTTAGGAALADTGFDLYVDSGTGTPSWGSPVASFGAAAWGTTNFATYQTINNPSNPAIGFGAYTFNPGDRIKVKITEL